MQPGRQGNSVYFPNVNSGDDSSLTLNTIGTCMAEIEICVNGVTVAFWVRVSQTQSSGIGSTVTIFLSLQSTGFVTRYDVKESKSRKVRYSSSMVLPFDQWQLVAFTYGAQSGPEVYLNGCLAEITTGPPKSIFCKNFRVKLTKWKPGEREMCACANSKRERAAL